MRRAVRGTVAVLLGTSVIAACTDPPAERVVPAGASGPTAAPSAPAGSPAVTPSGAASTGGPTVSALPESDLPSLTGYTYVRGAGVPDAIPGLDAEFVSGYVGRAVRQGTQPVGVVQLVRLRRVASWSGDFVESFVQQYAQTTEFDGERVAGRKVRTTSRLRGRPGGLVTWFAGRDLVLVYSADGVPAAKRLARRYLQAG